MDKIRIKLNHLEFAWLVAVVKSVVYFQDPGVSSMMLWAAVITIKKRMSKNGLVAVKANNIITLNGAEALVVWNIIGASFPLDHEIAWKLSIQEKMEKAIDKLAASVRNSFVYV